MLITVCDGQMLPPPSIVGGDYSSQYLYVGVFADHGVSDIDRFLLYITPEEDASVTVEHPEGTPFTYAGTAGLFIYIHSSTLSGLHRIQIFDTKYKPLKLVCFKILYYPWSIQSSRKWP